MALSWKQSEWFFMELARSRPDYQLVMNFAESVGYTKPLLLGSSPRLAEAIGGVSVGCEGLC